MQCAATNSYSAEFLTLWRPTHGVAAERLLAGPSAATPRQPTTSPEATVAVAALPPGLYAAQ
ncbi:MAG TPA: hypothetical protein VF690_16310 [Hymenobacter sp.]